MSHFTVLVIGKDHDKALAPFHEFECTGLNDEFIQEIENTDEVKRIFAEAKKKNETDPLKYTIDYFGLNCVTSREQVDITKDHKYGFAIVKDGEILQSFRRTNPNAKWDWYEVGGRWTGFFRLKEGKRGSMGRPGLMTKAVLDRSKADSALKGHVDFEGMRHAAEYDARNLYKNIVFVFGEMPKIEISWEQMRDEVMKGKPIDEIRDAYHAQPGVKKFKNIRQEEKFKILAKADQDILSWIEGAEFQCTEDEYAQRARDRAVSTFAVIKDGKWYQKGEMGWWGMVSNKNAEWESEFSKLLDSVPEDEILTVVDCHI